MATFQAASFLADISSSAVSSITWDHTVSAGTNLALGIGVGFEDIDAVVDPSPAPVFNGDSMTQVPSSRASSGSFGATELWGMAAPDVATAAIVVEFAVSSSKAGGGSVSATLVDQTTPFLTAGTGGATSGTTATATVSGIGSADLAFATLAVDSNVAVNVGGGADERWEVQESGAVTVAGSTRAGSAGGVETWTFTSRPWAISATAFKDDGSGGGATNWGPLLSLRNNRLVMA